MHGEFSSKCVKVHWLRRTSRGRGDAHHASVSLACAATALGQFLRYNNSCTVVDLDTNSVGDAGATALAKALSANEVLTTLKLSLVGLVLTLCALLVYIEDEVCAR